MRFSTLGKAFDHLITRSAGASPEGEAKVLTVLPHTAFAGFTFDKALTTAAGQSVAGDGILTNNHINYYYHYKNVKNKNNKL
jgi:hypothetical protein